ncbi:LAQU0S10e03114g1_1 [Lachancea quebecensis]|uniref:LAQU0S10e03114g1_1 n=1 Tax=Lachancea quebecensis TaxID=1654605 RepID=A0A0N7MLY1_9SACH|nr:LAQU0S10e03114g1_1 [Lachancea quebecensis]
MIRREPTVISLSPEDLAELEEELEEFKLQREIKAQQRNLQRSATVLAESDLLETEAPIRSGVAHESPLQKPAGQQAPYRPPSQSVNAGPNAPRSNPFFSQQ